MLVAVSILLPILLFVGSCLVMVLVPGRRTVHDTTDLHFQENTVSEELTRQVQVIDDAWLSSLGMERDYVQIVTNFKHTDNCLSSLRGTENTTTCHHETMRRIWLPDPTPLFQEWDCGAQGCRVNVTLPARDTTCIPLGLIADQIPSPYAGCSLPHRASRKFAFRVAPAATKEVVWKPMLLDVILHHRLLINGKEIKEHPSTRRLSVVSQNGYSGIFFLLVDGAVAFKTL